MAYYRDTEQGSAYAETTAYAAYAPLDRHIHVRSSNRKISVGEYVVFHVKSNFALESFDWIIVRLVTDVFLLLITAFMTYKA